MLTTDGGWLRKCYDWLVEVEKKDERRNVEELHQQRVKAVLGSCTRPRNPQHGEEERRSWRKKKRMSDRCEAKRK